MPNPRSHPVSRPKPRVAGMRRPQATPEATAVEDTSPAEEQKAAVAVVPPEPPVADVPVEKPEPRGPRPRGQVAPIALIVVAALFIGAAAWMVAKAEAGHRGALENKALTDTARTSEVIGQMTSAVQTVFSYDYSKIDEVNKAVRALVTPEAYDQYDTIYKAAGIKDKAVAQKLVVTTSVVSIGVERLEGDRALLLVFVYESSKRGDNNQSGGGHSQLEITADRSSGKWVISGIKVL